MLSCVLMFFYFIHLLYLNLQILTAHSHMPQGPNIFCNTVQLAEVHADLNHQICVICEVEIGPFNHQRKGQQRKARPHDVTDLKKTSMHSLSFTMRMHSKTHTRDTGLQSSLPPSSIQPSCVTIHYTFSPLGGIPALFTQQGEKMNALWQQRFRGLTSTLVHGAEFMFAAQT